MFSSRKNRLLSDSTILDDFWSMIQNRVREGDSSADCLLPYKVELFTQSLTADTYFTRLVLDSKPQIEDAKLTFTFDTSKPSQSVMKIGKTKVKELVVKTLGFVGKSNPEELQYELNCFEQMLRREQELLEDFVVFYHSYSIPQLLFEVQSVIASILFGIDEDFPPIPRLLFKPFRDIPNVEAFISLGRIGDTLNEFRQCGICVTTSIFAFSAEACPLILFSQGYSGGSDISFRSILTNLLMLLNIPSRKAIKIADEISVLGTNHGLLSRNYMGQRMKRLMKSAEEEKRAFYCGHLLQIFVNRHDVDKVAYESFPLGACTCRGPISTFLTKTSYSVLTGQARLCVNPEMMLDPNKMRVFCYSGDKNYSKNRSSFRKEVRTILLNCLMDPESIRKASCSVRDIPYTPLPRLRPSDDDDDDDFETPQKRLKK